LNGNHRARFSGRLDTPKRVPQKDTNRSLKRKKKKKRTGGWEVKCNDRLNGFEKIKHSSPNGLDRL